MKKFNKKLFQIVFLEEKKFQIFFLNKKLFSNRFFKEKKFQIFFLKKTLTFVHFIDLRDNVARVERYLRFIRCE